MLGALAAPCNDTSMTEAHSIVVFQQVCAPIWEQIQQTQFQTVK